MTIRARGRIWIPARLNSLARVLGSTPNLPATALLSTAHTFAQQVGLADHQVRCPGRRAEQSGVDVGEVDTATVDRHSAAAELTM